MIPPLKTVDSTPFAVAQVMVRFVAHLRPAVPSRPTEDTLGITILDHPFHIFKDMDGIGVFSQCLEKATPTHARIEQLEIHSEPFKFIQDRETLGNAARAVKEKAIGKVQGHALRVVTDELQFGLVGLKMQIVLEKGWDRRSGAAP